VALVELRDVRKEYPPAQRGGEPVHAIRGVDLDVEAGDIYAVVGYSGAGKSTLVRLVNALEPATSGTVTVDGVELTGLKERQLQRVRLGIGMIFQQFNLLHSRTVWGNLAYPLEVAGVGRAEQQQRISELLHFVGLADKAHQYPEQLSGGQKQRVGIARALATSPKLLLADEATSALDPDTTQEVLELLKRVNRELGITVVVITHEMDVVRSIANKVAVMENGVVVERGLVKDVFADPQHEVTKRFVGTVVDTVPEGEVLDDLRQRHRRLVTLEFREGSPGQSQVFAELLDRDVRFELVHGGIERVQGATFGNLTLALIGEPERVREAVAAVSRLVRTEELA
jgi:D-methionine transport system ATP-binding protein